jgi:hypothetical protein
VPIDKKLCCSEANSFNRMFSRRCDGLTAAKEWYNRAAMLALSQEPDRIVCPHVIGRLKGASRAVTIRHWQPDAGQATFTSSVHNHASYFCNVLHKWMTILVRFERFVYMSTRNCNAAEWHIHNVNFMCSCPRVVIPHRITMRISGIAENFDAGHLRQKLCKR